MGSRFSRSAAGPTKTDLSRARDAAITSWDRAQAWVSAPPPESGSMRTTFGIEAGIPGVATGVGLCGGATGLVQPSATESAK